MIREGLNIKIMELATSMAAWNGSDLHVVHAWQPIEQSFLRSWQENVAAAQTANWTSEARAAHQSLLDGLLTRFDLSQLKWTSHLIEGEAGLAIPDLAAKEQIDLIVMGTVARVGLEGYLIGNTADAVLHRVACSVLTVKPDGFVSPVKID